MPEKLPDDPALLKERIKELEKELAKKSAFFAVNDWQDALKILAIPTLIWAFWDEVVLTYLGRDSGSVEQVRENIALVQDIDQELYVLRAGGDDARATATEAAIIAKRDRIVAETFKHWENNPTYFRGPELQLLTHHLIVQNRTDDALDVFEDYWSTLKTPYEKAAGKLLEARIYGQDGPVRDIETAREQLREGAPFVEAIENQSNKTMMQGQFIYYRAELELNRVGDCTAAGPFVETLEELAGIETSGTLAVAANEKRREFDVKCVD